MIKNIKRYLSEEGIIDEHSIQAIFDLVTGLKDFAFAQTKFLEYLESTSPAMAQILTNVLKNGDKTFNYEGLLLHGALMEGTAIYNTAQDCMVRFFVKKQAEMD